MEREELLLRRMHGQHLLSPVSARQVCADLCGIQAQFLRNAIHALRLRSDQPDVTDLVKTWTLRGTVHLIPQADLPLYLRPCGGAEAVTSSGWYGWMQGRGEANPPEREVALARLLLEDIRQGITERDALRAALRSQGMTEQEEARAFHPWGGLVAELASVGALAFRVAMKDAHRPDETKAYRLLPPFVPMAEDAARVELLRRYFTHYGPATLRDAAYFFHWTQKDIRELMKQLPVEQSMCEGKTCFGLTGTADGTMPEVVLLAGFDPLMMGYRKEENPFLPAEHLRGIFNLAGIVHPAILLRGRVVGRWKEKDGRVELTAFEGVDMPDRRRIEAACERLFSVRRLIWS